MTLNKIFQGSLDLTSDNPPLMLEEVLTGGRTWQSVQLSFQDWMVHLSKDVIKEIHVMVDRIRADPLPILLRGPEEYEIPHLRHAMAQVRSILDEGCGFCVLDRLPLEVGLEKEILACYWVVSQLIGRTVAQKWDGTMIYDVTDTGQLFDYGIRGSYTNVELVFHNDNAFGVSIPEYVGLFCKNPSREGGLSRFCSLFSVHNRMLEEDRQLLERLYRPMLFDRQKEHAEGAPKTVWAPFFSWNGKNLKTRANVSLVYKGYTIEEKKMDEELTKALERLEFLFNSPDIWVEAPLKRGQIQFINNLELAHFRSRFIDHEDPFLKRHLFRTWHRNYGRRSYDG